MAFKPISDRYPKVYETVPTVHIKVSHYPEGTPTATPVVIVTLNRPKSIMHILTK